MDQSVGVRKPLDKKLAQSPKKGEGGSFGFTQKIEYEALKKKTGERDEIDLRSLIQGLTKKHTLGGGRKVVDHATWRRG